jgi:hypothetical protein
MAHEADLKVISSKNFDALRKALYELAPKAKEQELSLADLLNYILGFVTATLRIKARTSEILDEVVREIENLQHINVPATEAE